MTVRDDCDKHAAGREQLGSGHSAAPRGHLKNPCFHEADTIQEGDLSVDPFKFKFKLKLKLVQRIAEPWCWAIR